MITLTTARLIRVWLVFCIKTKKLKMNNDQKLSSLTRNQIGEIAEDYLAIYGRGGDWKNDANKKASHVFRGAIRFASNTFMNDLAYGGAHSETPHRKEILEHLLEISKRIDA